MNEKQVQRTRSQWEPSEHSVLCSDHFSTDSFEPRADITAKFLNPNLAAISALGSNESVAK